MFYFLAFVCSEGFAPSPQVRRKLFFYSSYCALLSELRAHYSLNVQR